MQQSTLTLPLRRIVSARSREWLGCAAGRLASLRLTFAGMCALCAGVLVVYLVEQASGWWLAGPLGVLAVNLTAAIAVNPRLNRRPGLLIFHLGLLGVIVLVACGRLLSFHGRVELVGGQALEPAAVEVVYAGPWHPGLAPELGVVQGPLSVAYAPGVIRQQTRSVLLAGESEPVLIGDNEPFVSHGYELRTTSNKGFAALVSWHPQAGQPVLGAVHFPSYPLNEWRQLNRWRPPGGEALTFELSELPRLDPERAFVLEASLAEPAGVRLQGSDRTLAVGDVVQLPGGRLRFEGLRLWMGYDIRYDPTRPWTFAAAVLGICGLGWHFAVVPVGRPRRRWRP